VQLIRNYYDLVLCLSLADMILNAISCFQVFNSLLFIIQVLIRVDRAYLMNGNMFIYV
jgi:hypothetical protein